MQLDFLKPLYATTGPYATAWFDVVPNENAAHEIELRWRGVREDLATKGVSEKLLDTMTEAALQPPSLPGPQGRIVVGAGEAVLLEDALPHPPGESGGAWEQLPHLMPLVAQYATVVPHIRVTCNRHSAVITVVGPLGTEQGEEKVKGGTYPIHRHGKGGWSTRRFEERAENLWDRNSRLVADTVDRLVAQTAAPLVVAAGDVRAVTYLEEHLGERARSVFRGLQINTEREGVESSVMEAEMQAAVAERARTEAQPELERFEQERGRQGLAVEGRAAVLDALRRAQVDSLLLWRDVNGRTLAASEGVQLYAGADPMQIGLTADEVLAMGADEAQPLCADDVLIRAACAADTRLLFVPSDGLAMQDGIGATLRYSDEATQH